MASNKGLGKGLGALLGDFSDESLEKSAYQMLPIYKVEPNPDQPRQDFDEEELQALADSIEIHGIIHFHFSAVYFQDRLTAFQIRKFDRNTTVKTSWS